MSDVWPISATYSLDDEGEVFATSTSCMSEWLSEHPNGDLRKAAIPHVESAGDPHEEVEVEFYEDGRFNVGGRLES